jgi:hypothetical protein
MPAARPRLIPSGGVEFQRNNFDFIRLEHFWFTRNHIQNS